MREINEIKSQLKDKGINPNGVLGQSIEKVILNLIQEIEELKKNNKLKRTGMAGFFSASLELTKEGLLNIMQKKSFDKILIKNKK